MTEQATSEMSLEDRLGNALGFALAAMQTNNWGNREIAKLETVFKAWCDKVVDGDAPDAPAKPRPGQLTNEELLALMPKVTRDDFKEAAIALSESTGNRVKPGIFRVTLNFTALEYVRAVLAHLEDLRSKEQKPIDP